MGAEARTPEKVLLDAEKREKSSEPSPSLPRGQSLCSTTPSSSRKQLVRGLRHQTPILLESCRGWESVSAAERAAPGSSARPASPYPARGKPARHPGPREAERGLGQAPWGRRGCRACPPVLCRRPFFFLKIQHGRRALSGPLPCCSGHTHQHPSLLFAHFLQLVASPHSHPTPLPPGEG